MEKKIYAREHDLLKLCDEFRHVVDDAGKAIRIHYCPEELARIDREVYEQLKKSPLWPSLRHHCNLGFHQSHKAHGCADYKNRAYDVTIDDLFLTLADTRASAISRKLRIGVKNQGGFFYRTVRIWKEGREGQPTDKPQHDEIVEKLCAGEDPTQLYKSYLAPMKGRAEDSFRFPFSSLDLHNRLVEKWYQFFSKNRRYFAPNPPARFLSAHAASSWLYDLTSRKGFRKKQLAAEDDGRLRKPIVFCRLKLRVNENLARINDVTIIAKVPELLAELVEKGISHAEPLYDLGDELILVRAFQHYDKAEFQKEACILDRAKQEIDADIAKFLGNRTNYEIEANLAVTYLDNKEFLNNFNKLFGPYQHRFGPVLPEKVGPEGIENAEARYAMLCELCQRAKATQAFRRFLDEEAAVVEHLCAGCFEIRTRQDEEGKIRAANIGSKIAQWQREAETPLALNEKPKLFLGYLKIELDYKRLLEVLKQRFDEEKFYPKRKITQVEEDLGFSVLFEFLEDYKAFLEQVKRELFKKYGAQESAFPLLPNFFCFRLEKPAVVKDMLKIFQEKYRAFFPKFPTAAPPVRATWTISTFKYPFFEAWRYLNRPKSAPFNVYWVRHFELVLSYQTYEALNAIDLKDRRRSRFLHNLAEIERHSDLIQLVEMEIWNNRDQFPEIAKCMRPSRELFKAQQLLDWYRLGEI